MLLQSALKRLNLGRCRMVWTTTKRTWCSNLSYATSTGQQFRGSTSRPQTPSVKLLRPSWRMRRARQNRKKVYSYVLHCEWCTMSMKSLHLHNLHIVREAGLHHVLMTQDLCGWLSSVNPTPDRPPAANTTKKLQPHMHS